jgi:glutathione synthase/RimK-type ligase-like ATP-grasp enzyme
MLMPFIAAGGSGVQMDERSRVVGMQAIVSHLFADRDITPLWNELMQRVTQDGTDAAAMLDLATILHTVGRTEEARQVLRGAVSLRRDFCIVHGNGQGLRLLAFVTPGDFMANTPLDFLLADSDCVLWLHYVDADTTSLGDLPAHDVAFMAIGELTENVPVLNRIKALLADFPRPVLNNDPELIRNLTRDGVSAMLAGEPSILSPRTLRFSRAELEAIASGDKNLSDAAPDLSFPLVVRPVSTHAGNGMERVATAAELAAWLEDETAPELYVAPFIDFRGPDLLYNKQRIVFIKGKAFASHMALSDHWIVHYLSAGMSQSAAKRAVEQAWMENFDTDFAVRHAEAFAALHRHIDLDYFGIDCAELPDGRLLVFEVDVAMVVHNMDSAGIYPYKQVAMRKLFDAFIEAVRGSAIACTPLGEPTDNDALLVRGPVARPDKATVS